jgi:hypothetical protein
LSEAEAAAALNEKKKFDHQKSIFVVEKQSSYSCASQFRWEDDGILPIKGF